MDFAGRRLTLVLGHRRWLSSDKIRTRYRRKDKSKVRAAEKDKEATLARSFDHAAFSFRSTVVELDRTPEQLAEESRVVHEYSNHRSKQGVAEAARQRRYIAERWTAVKDLPGPLRKAALQWDHQPSPKARYPFTDTPPVEDYDWSKSYSKKMG